MSTTGTTVTATGTTARRKPDTAQVPEIVPGRTYRIGRAASPQFGDAWELRFRVIKVLPRDFDDGWCWLVGYTISPTGDALERREIFIRKAGARAVPTPRG